MVPKSLPRKDVAQVHFDEGQRYSQKGVAQGDAGVRVARRVDDDERVAFAFRRLYLGDQLVFGVALERGQGVAAGPSEVGELGLDALQAGRTVNLRLAQPQEIQVRTIEQQNSSHQSLRSVRAALQRSAIITRNWGEMASFGGELLPTC